MRPILVAFLTLCFALHATANEPDAIAPGTALDAAKAIFRKHGFEVDASKYGVAMASRDPNNRLEFCPLDPEITLLIEYQASTGLIKALKLVVIPKAEPKGQLEDDRAQLSRNVLAVSLEGDGIYTIKMKRSDNREPTTKIKRNQ
jgi:hypothetical protein